MRRLRPRSEWARLAGSVALTFGWFVVLAETLGRVLVAASDAIGRL